jgi:hypothetical protein
MELGMLNSDAIAALIGAGVGLFDLSRLMGTSLSLIDKTYGHLLPDSLDRARTALDAFVEDSAVAADVG